MQNGLIYEEIFIYLGIHTFFARIVIEIPARIVDAFLLNILTQVAMRGCSNIGSGASIRHVDNLIHYAPKNRYKGRKVTAAVIDQLYGPSHSYYEGSFD